MQKSIRHGRKPFLDSISRFRPKHILKNLFGRPDSPTPEELDEIGTPIEVLRYDIDQKLDDPNFRDDLVYDGYARIEEMDNDAFSAVTAISNGLDNPEDELEFEESEMEIVMAEEDIIDQQENRSKV